MGAYRFVHSADVHLDSPLHSLALRDPRLAEFVGNASRQVFSRIVDLCLDEQVNALLLAGCESASCLTPNQHPRLTPRRGALPSEASSKMRS